MSRPLLIEFPGAVYHVTSRSDRREPIYLDALAEPARSAQREVPVLHIAYHVTSRSDRREPIYCDDDDRLAHPLPTLGFPAALPGQTHLIDAEAVRT